MYKIFSTAVVPQAEAYDLWIDVARVYICDHESSVPDRSRFCAAIEVGKLDDLSFVALAVGRLGFPRPKNGHR